MTMSSSFYNFVLSFYSPSLRVYTQCSHYQTLITIVMLLAILITMLIAMINDILNAILISRTIATTILMVNSFLLTVNCHVKLQCKIYIIFHINCHVILLQ
jgi:hypothetical protein